MRDNPFRHPLLTIARFEFFENIRNKWLFVYAFSFLIFGSLISSLGAGDPLRASASLLNLVLLLVPLFALVFGALSFSESLSFHGVLVSLPIRRRDIFWGKWLGLGLGLNLAFLSGMGFGALIRMNIAQAGIGDYLLLCLLGVMLTFVFMGLGFLIALKALKRQLIFGWILLVWFVFFVLYDLLIVGVALFFGDYPLEVPLLLMVTANPIDLARVMLLLHMDLSAMMGLSGALYAKYLGHAAGLALGSSVLGLWIGGPTLLSLKLFEKKDL